MKQIKQIVIALVAITLIGCEKFDDINTNPDSATKVTPSLLATGAIAGIVKPSWGAGFTDHLFITKYLAWGEGSRGNQYNDLGRESFGGYTSLRDYQLMGELATPENKNAYIALGLFLKVYRLYNHTIAVGDIPYKEILKGDEGILTPAYDTQKDVFLFLLEDLDKAYTLFQDANNFDGDIIFNGDVKKWSKVTTALQLRILINLSIKKADAELNITKRFNDIYKKGSLMESNDDNMQLKFSDKAGQLYPFHISGNKHSNYPMLSTTLVDMLKKHDDYRLFYYGHPSKVKLEEGLTPNEWDAYPGIDPSMSIETIKSIWAVNEHTGLNSRYINYALGEPFISIGYGEQNFILAEAALRNWIDADPDLFYKKAIRASFDFIAENTPDEEEYHHGRKLTEEVIDAFLETPSLQLDDTFENDLNKIIEQKYVASFMQLPYQAYYDYRRTGYPIFPINPTTNQNVNAPTKIPVRWLYPSSEFSYNKESVDIAIARQYGGVDEINKIMWLLKK